MPRPKKCRKVCHLPKSAKFTPYNKSALSDTLPVIIMTVDEYEAMRLIDKEGFSQEECSEYMKIARTTVQSIYTSARKKIAEAIVDGCILKIEGGDYSLCDGHEKYCNCGGCYRHRNYRERKDTMKIIIPLDENKTDVCMVFGRAPFFLLFNTDKKTSEIILNPAVEAEGGAGIKAAQCVVDSGASILITPRCGQNSAEVFKEADIAIYKSESGSALDNINAFLNNKLEVLTNFHSGFVGIQ